MKLNKQTIVRTIAISVVAGLFFGGMLGLMLKLWAVMSMGGIIAATVGGLIGGVLYGAAKNWCDWNRGK